MKGRLYETVVDPRTTIKYHGLEIEPMDCKDDKEHVRILWRKTHRDTSFSMKAELAPGPSISIDCIGRSFTVWTLHTYAVSSDSAELRTP